LPCLGFDLNSLQILYAIESLTKNFFSDLPAKDIIQEPSLRRRQKFNGIREPLPKKTIRQEILKKNTYFKIVGLYSGPRHF